jgi:hypothetical protein
MLFYGISMCRHRHPMRKIPDPSNTPDWCEMRADMLRDATIFIEKSAANKETPWTPAFP